MFGALNRFIARLDSDSPPQSSNNSGDGGYGFQVLRNKNSDVPIEPWFDFIIGINSHMIDDPDAYLFTTEIRNCAGGHVSLDLWSAKGQKTHSLTLPVPRDNPTLGLTLQLSPLSSTQNIWHILNIPSPLSPAHEAGLLPHSDYILGTPSGTLRGESALGELVEDHLNRTLVLWVYNSEFDVVREVELIPRRGWGGEGALGAVLGFGALHRLPVGLGEEVQQPGEALFEAARTSTDRPPTSSSSYPSQAQPPFNTAADAPPPQYLIPANIASPPLQSPPPVTNPTALPPRSFSTSTPARQHGRKARHHNMPSPNSAFEDYFKEGEQKSREQDFAPSRKGTPSAPPPPPKAGGTGPPPPRAGASPVRTASPAPSQSPAPDAGGGGGEGADGDEGEPGEAVPT